MPFSYADALDKNCDVVLNVVFDRPVAAMVFKRAGKHLSGVTRFDNIELERVFPPPSPRRTAWDWLADDDGL